MGSSFPLPSLDNTEMNNKLFSKVLKWPFLSNKVVSIFERKKSVKLLAFTIINLGQLKLYMSIHLIPK